MKKKLRLRSNSIYKEEILQLIDDVIPMVEEFYRKRDITVTAILYDYATDIVSFEFDAPKGYYPKFSFYIDTSATGVRHPTGRRFMGGFTMEGVGEEFQKEMIEQYGIGATKVKVGSKMEHDTTKEKIQYIFDMTAPRIAKWDARMLIADIFLF